MHRLILQSDQRSGSDLELAQPITAPKCRGPVSPHCTLYKIKSLPCWRSCLLIITVLSYFKLHSSSSCLLKLVSAALTSHRPLSNQLLRFLLMVGFSIPPCNISHIYRLRGLCYFCALHPFPPHEGHLRPLQPCDQQQQPGPRLGEPASQ